MLSSNKSLLSFNQSKISSSDIPCSPAQISLFASTTILLLATLCTSLFFVFSQIKIRYSIKYSDALSVRLFYSVPSVIIYEFLLIIRVLPIFDEPPCDNNKRSRNLPDQRLVSCFPLHHMGFPICKQYYDNLICWRLQSPNSRFL